MYVGRQDEHNAKKETIKVASISQNHFEIVVIRKLTKKKRIMCPQFSIDSEIAAAVLSEVTALLYLRPVLCYQTVHD